MTNQAATTASTTPPAALREAWHTLHRAEPDLRARDLARKLDVSEGELVACRCGQHVIRLQGPWDDLIRDLPKLGRVMALTRNASCVHEIKGVYDGVDLGKTMGVVLGDPIDLRIFLKYWHHGFAVNEASHGRVLDSLQFFAADGTAIHKVYQTEDTDRAAWQSLIAKFTAPDQSPGLATRTVKDPLPPLLDDSAVDVTSLQAGWRAMRDPHDYFNLLHRHRVTRLQALRVAGREFAYRVGNAAVQTALERARDTRLPIMTFVGSPGVVQIRTGTIRNIRQVGEWLNVLDPDFNLHLRADHIAESWVVDKPSPEGPIASLELYAADGLQIAQFFGQRKRGIAPSKAWRELAMGLPPLAPQASAASQGSPAANARVMDATPV